MKSCKQDNFLNAHARRMRESRKRQKKQNPIAYAERIHLNKGESKNVDGKMSKIKMSKAIMSKIKMSKAKISKTKTVKNKKIETKNSEK